MQNNVRADLREGDRERERERERLGREREVYRGLF
jgi:hypothetical protein